MRRRLPLVLALLLAGAASAQEAGDPPVAPSDPPALQDTAPAADALPTLPDAGVAVAPVAAAPAALPAQTDLTALVLKAHPVVQAVMALLAAAVFAVVTVFLFKTVEFSLAFSRLDQALRGLAARPDLSGEPSLSPLGEGQRAAQLELEALPSRLTPDLRASARERLDLSLDRIEARAVQRLRSGTGLLASIGAVGPFVGLFGTVFGIMNSFLAISATKSTNLAVVAPGIAEALLATGIGLVAAIPAVLLYNRMMRRIAAYRHRLADGRAEILRRFSHALDARMAAGG